MSGIALSYVTRDPSLVPLFDMNHPPAMPHRRLAPDRLWGGTRGTRSPHRQPGLSIRSQPEPDQRAPFHHQLSLKLPPLIDHASEAYDIAYRLPRVLAFPSPYGASFLSSSPSPISILIIHIAHITHITGSPKSGGPVLLPPLVELYNMSPPADLSTFGSDQLSSALTPAASSLRCFPFMNTRTLLIFFEVGFHS